MRKALLIGIDDYTQAPLNCCVNDAVAVNTLLERNGDGSPNFDTRLETNISSQAELRRNIQELFSGCGDIALLFFAGHGLVNELGGYLVTPDAKAYAEGVPMNDILEYANNSLIANKIIILDCCYSGNIGNLNLGTTSQALLKAGTTILTASQENECSLEVNGHGIFSNLLIEALQGGAADLTGNVTPGGIYAFVDQALGPWLPRPIFKTYVKQFVSLRKICPQVPLDIIRKLTTYFPSPEALFQLDPSFEDTNTPSVPHKIIEPYANSDNVAKFKDLQKLQSIGLVVPDESPYMYFAAMESKNCRLTALGAHYWKLVNENRI